MAKAKSSTKGKAAARNVQSAGSEPNPSLAADLSPYLAQHLDLALVSTADGNVRVNVSESPLVWLARRKGRDGRPLIAPDQLQAGERLRTDFTLAQMMPRVTSNWSAAIAQSRRGGSPNLNVADTVIAARQRVRHALDAVGPEFSGLLLDVCCFLKGLDDVEHERHWPARSGKVVLSLALDGLARHYGLGRIARGPNTAKLRAWSPNDASPAAADPQP